MAGIMLAQASLPAEAQTALRTARGLASDDVSVLINRAVVVESAEPFVEVSVAQPEIADVSPLSDRAIYIFGRARGTTTLTLLGNEGRLIANVDVVVTPDLSELKERLAETLPDEPIDVRSGGGGVILSGVVSGAAKIDRAIALAQAYTGSEVTNMMSVGGSQQVALKIRIAEMSRAAGKSLGLSTGAVGSTGRTATLAQTGDDVDVNTEAFNDPDSTEPIFEQALSGTGIFGSFGAVFAIADSFLLDVTLTAAENKGFARTLAEPTLVALSGTQASFLAGGEVPIPVFSEDGASIQFKPIGVSLNFVPTVIDGDLIHISVNTEQSAIDPDNSTAVVSGSGAASATIVGFSVRRATTTIELRDGESFAIAGLYNEEFSDSVDQLPWVGDLPIIGNLFRSVTFQKGESELVIIVTADIVTPVEDEGLLAIPQDRIALPNEGELFFLGRTQGQGASAPGAAKGFDGSYGYVVE
ncbi:MAG: type II and III secretion system protein family protein [Paracoccaceae bacterium]